MVPVQMAVDHDVDGFGVDAVARDHFGQGLGLGRQFGAFAAAGVHLVAAAGFDQDGVLAGADNVAVEAERDAIEFVDRGLAAPKRLGDDAEHGTAIPPVDGIADQGQGEIAHLSVTGGRSSTQPLTSLRPRSKRSAASSTSLRPRSNMSLLASAISWPADSTASRPCWVLSVMNLRVSLPLCGA